MQSVILSVMKKMFNFQKLTSNKLIQSLFFVFILSSNNLTAQILNQTFRTGSIPSGWSQSSVTFTTSASGYANFTNTSAVLTSPVFDGSSFASININFNVAKFGSGGNGPITVEYSLNGGSTWSNLGNSPTPTSSTYLSASLSISSVSNNMRIRFRRLNSPSQKRFRDLVVSGVGSALCSAPSSQASNISFSNVLDISMDVSWNNGNGAGRVVLMNTSNTFTAPSNGSNPTANTTYTSGQQVIYNGTGNSVSVSGLSASTTYWFRVYEYCSPDRVYNSGTASNNPRSQATTAPTFTPSLTAGSLSPFGNECIAGTYGPNTFTISGSNLTAANNVTVGALSGYQFATSAGGPYLNSLSISQPGGTFNQTIYVRFLPVAAVNYNGNIAIGGGGASSVNVLASGTGINTPPTALSGASSSITYAAATIEGSISDIGCSSISAYGVEYSTSSGFTPGTGTQVPSSNLSAGNFSSNLTGLDANQTYYYLAYATNSGGTAYGSESSFTTLNLDAPIANPGSGIGDFAFMANWDPVIGATGYRLDVSTTPFTSANATDLFISEYVEGSANNKYIEIFNGTGAPVNLSNYRLRLFSNGAASPNNDVLLSGTLANNDVIVYENSSAAIYAGIPNAAINFNGDDAVALWKISTSSYVDIFGVIGDDPGSQWTLGGNNTADQTLVRNADISGGVTVNPSGTGPGAFLTLATEWTEFPQNNVLDLGSHTFNSGGATYVPGYQDLAVAGISQLVSGLSPNTQYYYRVRAVSSTSTSDNSNVISVLTTNTGCASGVNISSFSPTSGPEGTRVTITGTNFSTATSVTFNNIPATYFTIISSTEIEAQVPATTSGIIRVADSGGCFDNSSGSFTFIGNTGTCIGVLSDIIISEGYDPQSGINHYIEIYNGTGNAVDLNTTADYSLRLLNKSSVSDPSPTTYNLDITGVINPGETKVYFAGANGGLASLPALGFNNGFNEWDEIILLKDNVIIDRVQFPNNVGYNYRRLNTVTGPNTTYTAAEWNRIETGENTSDIGIFVASSDYIISTQPPDAAAEPCDPFDLIVQSSNPAVGYQWYKLNSLGNWIAVIPSVEVSGYDTNQLTIDPSIGYDGVQFYCQISRALCTKRSNAVQFDEIPNPRRYFRSAGSGSWVGDNIWEYASTPVGPWSTSCFPPSAETSDEIVIQNGHSVIVNSADITIDQVIIELGGNLSLSASDAITFANGPGVDFIIEGTFTDNTNSGGGNGVFMNSGATWQMGNSGTLIKTNNSSFAVYRDNYEGGMANIPATSTVIIRSVSGSNPSYTAVGNTFYPNLTFESTGGNWNPVVLGSRFNGASDFPTIKGNLDIGGSGLGIVTIYNQNTNATPLTVEGDVIVRTGNTLTNAGTVNGTGFDFKGNVSVDGTFNVNSTTNQNYLLLSGNSTQSLSGSGIISVFNLRVNNSSTFGIDLQRNLTVVNELQMIDGNIQIGSNLLTLGFNTTNIGSLNHTDGYVIGRMRRWFNGTNAGDVSGKFPMGILSADYYDRSVLIEYNSAPTTPGHLTVEYINSPMANVNAGIPIAQANTGGTTFDVVYVEDEGFWQIDNQTGTLTDGLYSISLTGEEVQSITDVSNLTLLKRVGSGPWTCPGNHIIAAGPVSKPIVSRSAVFGFSNFGFGSGASNPLPIELLSFTATPQNDIVNLDWVTGSEINNQFFTVERSIDALNFEEVLRKDGIGNSSATNYYSDVDTKPLMGLSYYRLKQTDYNGNFSYSQIVPVSFNQTKTVQWMNINPSNGNINGFSNSDIEFTSYRIYSLGGKIISAGALNSLDGSFNINSGIASKGLYFVELLDKNEQPTVFKLVF